MPETKHQRLLKLKGQLEDERSSFVPHWRDLSDFILPRRARFSITDQNRGDRRNQKIIDSTATLASRTLRSGMVAGLTSPARPWFRLSLPDTDMAEFGPIKDWLHLVTQLMSTMFLRSNIYQSLPNVYGDMGNFATGCLFVDEDFQNVLHSYVFPTGSYCISTDEKGRVRVFSRELRMTVRQLVMMFGQYDQKTGRPMWEHFSETVKNLWDRSMYETWIDVAHIIQPNDEWDPQKSHNKFKKYSEHYFELSSNQNQLKPDFNRFLRESGRDIFPVLCPRWDTTFGDVYGTDCPGMTALGDVKQLQSEQKRKAQGLEQTVKPAMVGPTAMRNVRASILPGDITYTDERDGTKGFRRAFDIRLDLAALTNDIQEIRHIIKRAYYEDLFLMLAQTDRREITAREIDERKEEKLLALGPVLEQTNQDMLDPLIDLAYEYMAGQGLLPPPPPELDGQDLKVEYISVMAQAQKLIGVSTLERFSSFAGQVASLDARAAKKVRWDEVIDDYGERSGVNPKIIRSDEEVDKLMSAEAQAQQQAAAAEQIQGGAKVAKDLANAKLEDDSALKRILQTQGAA